MSKRRRNRHSKPLVDRPEVRFTYEEIDPKVMCPYCLFESPLSHFKIILANGKESKRKKCPDCGTIMFQETLTREMSVKEFANWVFEYMPYGFWQKIDFQKFSKRLQEKGIAREFWDEYKRLKGTIAREPSYSEYMNQQGREYARKWNRGEGRE